MDIETRISKLEKESVKTQVDYEHIDGKLNLIIFRLNSVDGTKEEYDKNYVANEKFPIKWEYEYKKHKTLVREVLTFIGVIATAIITVLSGLPNLFK
jgi:hypothetical protein